MTRASAPETPRIEPAGFFVLRTPALPFDEVERWGAGLEAARADSDEQLEAALERDRRRLRRRLAAVTDRPDVLEALTVASPALVRALDSWRAKPDSKKGRRAEAALVRYFLRMATRPTPFGVFAGWSLGRIGGETLLAVGDRSGFRRHARLDMNYLSQLAQELARSDELRPHLRYRPNSSLYRAAGRYRFSQARLTGGVRSYHLVAVEASDYLEAVLERARGGASGAALARTLVEWDPDGEITGEEAAGFIADLAEVGLLESELDPALTGREPVHGLIEVLSRHRSTREAASRLESARAICAELATCPPAEGTELIRQATRTLRELPVEIQPGRLFQIDMSKPGAHASLGPEVVRLIERGIDLLLKLAEQPYDPLAEFRRHFLERYESDQEVPLVEALDEETGIGFPREGGLGADGSPLLAGLVFPPPADGTATYPLSGAGLRARLLEQALRSGSVAVELDPAWLPDPVDDSAAPLPDAFQVMAILAEAPEDGATRLLLHNVYGPSGARLLGRFCHADETLREAVRAHLAGEEKLEPDAVFAEVVHLPEGRMGNILCRPLLRRYEIPFLGRSGAPEDRRIPIDDLSVSIAGGEVVLRSRRLDRRVLPRLSSAHNFTRRSLGIYRFLCSLQSQGVRETVLWSWGQLEGAPFLPRVTCGRLVLSRASWRLFEDEIARLTSAEGAARFRAAQQLRRARRLPRRVVTADSDHELLVDFDNILSIEAFSALLKNRVEVPLMELFPGDLAELPARGAQGRFTHELLIPFVRRREVARRRLRRPAAAVRRRFPPGSEWSYLKLYTGTATADRVLRESLGPLLREATGRGDVERWFFVRYGDPQWHLRVRVRGEPRRLRAEVVPRLEEAAARLLEAGLIWRSQFDTYQREVERYGGADGIRLAEQLAAVDSEAVLGLLDLVADDEGAEARWRLALVGSDRLLSDVGLDEDEKLAVLRRMQDSFAREFRVDAGFRKQLSNRLREHREELERLLGGRPGEQDERLALASAVLDRRGQALAPLRRELRRAAAEDRLDLPLTETASSYVHMFNNRLLRSEARPQELVIYDFLTRLAESRAARRKVAAFG